MANSDELIRKAIRALEAEKQATYEQFRLLDLKIARLEQVLRDEAKPVVVPRAPGEPSKRGEAEREILQMLSQEALTAAEIATRRGTSTNAASNVLRRLHKRGQIEQISRGRYARQDGRQYSLNDSGGGP